MALSDKIFKGAAWSAVERLSVQTVQFILGIILARILSPADFGVIGLLMVFVSFLQIFVDSGFIKALIQKQDRTDVDISTVFFFNLMIGIVSFFIVWVTAPLVADFYKNPGLVKYLRVLASSLIINSFFAVPATLLSIKLDFRSMARVNVLSVSVSGVVAVLMARKGFGIWALVCQNILRSILAATILWIIARWRPMMVFSKASLKSMFGFGSKLLYSSLLIVSVNNFTLLFIAKITSTRNLGFYTRGTQFADMVQGSFNSVLDSVLLPSLATIQHEKDRLITYIRFVIKATALVCVPILLGLATIANPLIKFLLTDKWLEAVPVMQIICVARLITLISTVNVNLLYVTGRTDLVLRQQYIKLAVRIVFLVFAFKFGIIFIALAELSATAVHFFINTYYPGKMMKYGALSQIKDLRQIIFAALIMVGVIWLTLIPTYNLIIKLFVSTILGFITYLSAIYLLKVKELFWIVEKVNERLFKKGASA